MRQKPVLAYSRPSYVRFVRNKTQESSPRLELHLKPDFSGKPVSSIELGKVDFEKGAVHLKAAYLLTPPTQQRKGFSRQVFASYLRVLSRLSRDLGVKVVDSSTAKKNAVSVFKNFGYSVSEPQEVSSLRFISNDPDAAAAEEAISESRRVVKTAPPLNHVLNAEEEKFLVWLKEQVKARQQAVSP